MRILFQGAGAVGIAGAALLGRRHETVVVTRTPLERPRAAYPRRVRWLDAPTDSDTDEPGWSVTDVAATRRVTITDWAGIDDAGGFRIASADDDPVASGPLGSGVSVARARAAAQHGKRTRSRVPTTWDLVVLTTRPGDLDAAVASAIRAVAPRWLAITSQVGGDVGVAKGLFPGAEVVVFSPAFLSERLAPSPDIEPGHEVRFWSPFGAPVFLAAGPKHPLRALARELGPTVVTVPLDLLISSPTLFIPYVAQLSAGGGEWERLLDHLRLPSDAAAEAVRAVTGVPVPVVPAVARAVLEAADRISPIPMREYAGRHFARHEGQTLAMLDGWISAAREHEALSALAAELRTHTGGR
ncbi:MULTISPECIES: hypothetical protein [unclassified Brevibacterium]|uniref:hypothetical protein n=1 Tax=unclassified Brevibacterium TaxID=2614124 RepID=UPI0010F8BBBE|nr:MULTISPECIES: hypothetical protein [unclassified Brevibacterium]MCM1011437.1 hypothetical protein [Brevibacterium sp. XM4083]